jgi:hypothetical protein
MNYFGVCKKNQHGSHVKSTLAVSLMIIADELLEILYGDSHT